MFEWILTNQRLPELIEQGIDDEQPFFSSKVVLVRYVESASLAPNDELPVALATLSEDGTWCNHADSCELTVVAWMKIPAFTFYPSLPLKPGGGR